MKSKYKVKTTIVFERTSSKLVRKNPALKSKIIKVLMMLGVDPFYRGLNTHKVQSKNYGSTYASRVTGDLRILWDFSDNKVVIVAVAIGGHSGKNAVYR